LTKKICFRNAKNIIKKKWKSLKPREKCQILILDSLPKPFPLSITSYAERWLTVEQSVSSWINCFHKFVIVPMVNTAQRATKLSLNMLISDKIP